MAYIIQGMRLSFSFALISLIIGACTAQPATDEVLGPPPERPSLFLPGIVSAADRFEYGSAFNSDLTEFYFGVQNDGWSDIHMMRLTKEGWTTPEVIIGSPVFSANDPFLSADNSRLYFISPRQEQYDIGYVTRQGDEGWGSPIFPPMPINSDANEYYISFSRDGSIVFASDRNATQSGDFDIYHSRPNDDNYETEVPYPDAINTNNYEADAFIAPDESYLIFSANRPDGFGRGDLYISFAIEGDAWSKAVSMGPLINSEGHELCPFVTKDDRYFFFTSKQDIYWVSAEIIETFRPIDGVEP